MLLLVECRGGGPEECDENDERKLPCDDEWAGPDGACPPRMLFDTELLLRGPSGGASPGLALVEILMFEGYAGLSNSEPRRGPDGGPEKSRVMLEGNPPRGPPRPRGANGALGVRCAGPVGGGPAGDGKGRLLPLAGPVGGGRLDKENEAPPRGPLGGGPLLARSRSGVDLREGASSEKGRRGDERRDVAVETGPEGRIGEGERGRRAL